MSEARAYARLQWRRFLGSWEWLSFVVVVGYAFFFGHSPETIPYVVFFVFLLGPFRDGPRRGDTGFSSMQAYLVSRPMSRHRVYRWRATNDLLWALGIVTAAVVGLWRRVAQADPSEFVCATEPIVSNTFSLSFIALCTLCALFTSDALSPFAKVSRPQRKLTDRLFVVLAWVAYAAALVFYMLVGFHAGEPASYLTPVVLWSTAGLAGFFVVHRSQMWRRYDFVTSLDHKSRAFSWLSPTKAPPASPRSGRGVIGLMQPLFIYPPLVWLAFEAMQLWLTIDSGRSMWPSPGLASMFAAAIAPVMLGAFTWSFYYAQGPVAAYALSRPATRRELARTNSAAFGLGGLVVVGLLAAIALYTEGHFERGALLLPWAWLLFLTAGTVAMAASLAAPTFNSPIGLIAAIVLIATTAAAILVKKPPEGWNTPLGAAVCVATAFALGALVIIVADRHVRSADIG
jgi:hypothetical protein